MLAEYRQVYVIYDRNVEKFALEVAEGRDAYPLTADESHKCLSTVEDICRWLMEKGADREALLLSVGGGVTSDITGFAAGIYKRGIRYANIPTTLLSMVDAGIGGKTGVNFDGYKNMLGVFCQPEFTYLWPEALNTLPMREWRSGTAELLKTFLIKDKEGYENTLKVLHTGFGEMPDVINRAAAIKQGIVNEDPYENGIRRILNLGHTFAHAIEWKQTGQENALTHGEAVAIGIVRAAVLSEKFGIAKTGLAAKIEKDFKSCNLPTELPYTMEELLPAILRDKKAEDDGIVLVLLEDIGKAVLVKVKPENL